MKTNLTQPIPPAQSVPDGWQLVPVEPTREMIDAHASARIAFGGSPYITWAKMLAAAPKPEVG